MDTLMTVGGFVPLSYVFYGVIQNARQHRQLNWLGILLAFAGVLLPVGLITYGVLSGQSELFLVLAAFSSAGVMVLFGLIAVVQDARAGRPVSRSIGLMGVIAGVLIIAAVLLITQVLPLVTATTTSAASTTTQTQFTTPAGMTLPEGAAANNAAASEPTAATTDTTTESTTVETMDVALPAAPAGFALPSGETDTTAAAVATEPEREIEAVHQSAPEGEVVLTSAAAEDSASGAATTDAVITLDDFVAGVLANIGEIELPALTATRGATTAEPAGASADRASTTAAASEPAAVVAGECTAVVRNNLNLRAEASASGELLTTIPFSTVLSPASATDDGWWQVTYNGMTGWVSGDFLDFASVCAS